MEPAGETKGPDAPDAGVAHSSARAQAALVPLRRGHASVVHLRGQWFIASTSRAVRRRKPVGTAILGTPLVLFRDADGRAGALVDRCPHRNVPLSLGTIVNGNLQCAYHGWRFDPRGACTHVPSLTHVPESRACRALALPTIEQQGFVWVYTAPSQEPPAPPATTPHHFAYLGAKGYSTVSQVVEAEGTLYSTLENALDVPHTAFLHRGLFRSASRGIRITAKVKRTSDRVVAEYVGEPRPEGIIARILSPSGGVVSHHDRFLLPSIAQVEYSIGSENHFLVDSVMTPIDDYRTRIYAVVSFKSRLPHFLIRPFIKPLALRVFRQDAFILKAQTETIHAFGGEQYASTEIDVLGKHIWRLLKSAERGEVHGGEEDGEVELVV